MRRPGFKHVVKRILLLPAAVCAQNVRLVVGCRVQNHHHFAVQHAHTTTLHQVVLHNRPHTHRHEDITLPCPHLAHVLLRLRIVKACALECKVLQVTPGVHCILHGTLDLCGRPPNPMLRCSEQRSARKRVKTRLLDPWSLCNQLHPQQTKLDSCRSHTTKGLADLLGAKFYREGVQRAGGLQGN